MFVFCFALVWVCTNIIQDKLQIKAKQGWDMIGLITEVTNNL